MKFSHDFSESLKREEYPQQWVASAINYRLLKKCIKKVQEELTALGLDQSTLNHLWQSTGSDVTSLNPEQSDQQPRFHYSLSNDITSFVPTLTFAINPEDGSPVDAWLSEETKQHLLKFAQDQRMRNGLDLHSHQENETHPGAEALEQRVANLDLRSGGVKGHDQSQQRDLSNVETIEIPLHSDAEFFQILRRELTTLDALQGQQQRQLTQEITRLGQDISSLSTSSSSKDKSDMYTWREIFHLYAESQIFFTTSERNRGARSAVAAQEHLQTFTNTLAKHRTLRRLRKPGRSAFDTFLAINSTLLQTLKFQEINRTALSKIMKKFDKRTALHARSAILPPLLEREPFFAQSIAKAICCEISEGLLTVIPQLEDYLCPICMSISFKPIRLKCGHVFCIRCLIVMQRAEQDHCPMCRGNVVMSASSCELDEKLMAFLKEKFPEEVKAKQKENERAAGIDQYGEAYDTKCAVM